MSFLEEILVIFCLFAVSNCRPEENELKYESPVEGIKVDPDSYPEKDISAALEKLESENPELRKKIETDAESQEIIAAQKCYRPIYRFTPVCESKFVSVMPHGWTYLDPEYGYSWILRRWWAIPITYSVCIPQTCADLSCNSKYHYCLQTNFKTFGTWSWCRNGGFRYREFRLPQCCECHRLDWNIPIRNWEEAHAKEADFLVAHAKEPECLVAHGKE